MRIRPLLNIPRRYRLDAEIDDHVWGVGDSTISSSSEVNGNERSSGNTDPSEVRGRRGREQRNCLQKFLAVELMRLVNSEKTTISFPFVARNGC